MQLKLCQYPINTYMIPREVLYWVLWNGSLKDTSKIYLARMKRSEVLLFGSTLFT